MRPKRTIEELEASLQKVAVSTEYIDVANDLSFELFLQHLDTERAHKLATETFDLCTGPFSGYRQGLAEALINLAFYQTVEPDLPEALRLILQARSIIDTSGDDMEFIGASFKQLRIMRFIYALMEDYAAAIEVNIERVKLAQKVGEPAEEMAGIEALVYDCYRVDQHTQALAYSEKAHALAKRLGDDSMHAHIHMTRTYPLRKLGQYDLALHNALQAYSFYEGQGSRLESITIGILGYIHLESKEYDKAMAYFQQELALVDVLDSDYLRAYAYCEIGMVHLESNRLDEAIQWLESGTQLAESHGLKSPLIDGYPHLVKAYKAQQNYEQALIVFEKLADVRAEVNNTTAANHRNVLLVIHETEQARLEARLQQERAEILRTQAENLAQQNALIQRIDTLKNELVATASHDMRNPLTAVGMDLFLLKRMTENLPDAQRYIDRLLKNVEHVKHLIEDLLDFSNIQESTRPETARWDLVNLVQESVLRHRALAGTKAIDLTEALPDHPVHMMLDARQFERVLDNLLSNAIKYTSEGGKVTISLETNDGRARLSVRDSGRGIPASEIPHVFDSRFRASNSLDQKGEGHGLSIVKKIVDGHRGEIVCESVVGSGSTFTVSLPC